HAHADGEHGLQLALLTQQRINAEAADTGHAVAHGTDAWKYEAVGGLQHGRIGSDRNLYFTAGAAPDELERLGHGVQIPHAIVDDGNVAHVSRSACPSWKA